jgi:hypothetical protein
MPNYTRIEDLPDIDEVNNNGRDDEYRPRDTNKFIRNNRSMMPSDAGMGSEGLAQGGYGRPPPGSPYPQFQGPQEMIEQPMMEVREMPPRPSRPDPMSFNCIDIANHIQQCPICSRFYHGDKSLYIVVIVVLAIVCLLLLKRVLNV